MLSVNFILPTEASHYDGKPGGDYWDKPIKEDSPTTEHNANVQKKMKVVEQVRELRKQGFNKGEIARLAGINSATVAKYLKEDFDPSSPYYNTTIPSKIKPCAKDIKDMLSEGETFRQISAAIREKGYDGSDSTICMFATRERYQIVNEYIGYLEKNMSPSSIIEGTKLFNTSMSSFNIKIDVFDTPWRCQNIRKSLYD